MVEKLILSLKTVIKIKSGHKMSAWRDYVILMKKLQEAVNV